MTRAWWSDLVGYQVYLPSYADSNGDGWGDLDGVREHLDYLVWLGVDAVWLTPFYVTPMRDGGYDVADYRNVDPRFGDDEALDELIRCAHERKLRILGDLVVNHTSSDHPWFRDAQRSLAANHRDFYIWRRTGANDRPPNNWLSHFGGPAWTRSEATGESYLHLFSADQPDLNWANPAVADAVDEIMQYWYGRGIDGFRIDTAGYLAKHPGLRDNPARLPGSLTDVTGATREWRAQEHLYDIHQPEVAEIHARWRFAGNDGADMGAHRALAVHALLALLPGPLWIYQGDELGLPNSDVDGGGAYEPLAQLAEDGGRDAVRTPMPWDDGPANGFTIGSPWLSSADRPAELTVAHQRAQPDSTLRRMRRLLATRRTIASELADHTAQSVATSAETLVRIDRGPITGLVNLGDTAAPIDADLAGADLIFNTDESASRLVGLAPLQAAWWRHPTTDGEPREQRD